MSKTVLPAVVLALFLSAAAAAQTGKPADGDRLTSDVWVQLTLKNGAQVEGLAAGGVLYERLEKGRFASANPESHRDAGLRLHFVDYNEGFLFIRAKDVLRIDSQKTLTTSEQAQIRALVKRRQEAVAAASASAAAAAEGRRGGTGAVPGAPDTLTTSADQFRKRLFAKFPPADGWGPVRRDEILKKRWTVGVFPDAQEREFLDNFEDWMTEYQSALEEAPKDGGAPGGTPPAPLPPPPPAGDGDGSGGTDEKGPPPGENASRNDGGHEGRGKEPAERRRGE